MVSFEGVGHHNIEIALDNDWASGRQLLEVCPEFRAGNCDRGAKRCKFAHPDENCRMMAKSVNVCLDSLMRTKKCAYKGDCRYYHPPPHILFEDVVRGRIDICREFMEEECHTYECPKGHPEKVEQIIQQVAICDVSECQDPSCEYYHGATSAVPPPREDICFDYTQGNCHRANCRFSHDTKIAPPSRNTHRQGRSRSPKRRVIVRQDSRERQPRGRPDSRDRGSGRMNERDMWDMMWNFCSMMSSSSSRDKPDFRKMGEMFQNRGRGGDRGDRSDRGGDRGYDRGDRDRREERGDRDKRESDRAVNAPCRDWMNGKCNRGQCRFEHLERSGGGR